MFNQSISISMPVSQTTKNEFDPHWCGLVKENTKLISARTTLKDNSCNQCVNGNKNETDKVTSYKL